MVTAAPARGQQQNNAVARVDANVQLQVLAAELDRREAVLRESAATLIDPVKLKGIVLSTFTRTPSLWECDPVTIARAVVEAAQAGLEPTGSLGGAYLVPFFNSKTGKKEAQLIIGYTGLVKLARRSGEVSKVEARIVRQADEFDFGYGLAPYVTHRPALGLAEDAANPMTHVYAVAYFRDGTTQFDVMSAAEVLAIKARSKSKDRNGNATGPWVTDEAEMWKKTALRRLSKLMPLTVEAQRALDAEDSIEHEPRNVTPVRAPAPRSRIASRVVGELTANTYAPASGGNGPDQGARAVQPSTSVPAAESAPDAASTADGADDRGPVTADGEIIDGDAVEVALCGDPSPYGDATTCTREQGHPDRIMCTDGSATWKRGAAA